MNLDTSGCDTRRNFTAGFELLDKFQAQWQNLHSRSEKNVIKAEEALGKIHAVERSSSRRLGAIDELIKCYQTLPRLNEQIKNISVDLRLLEDHLAKTEDLLIVLQNHKEHRDNERYLEEAEANHQSRLQELQRLSNARRHKLKIEHLERVDKFEQEQQKELAERRLILQKAFEEEKSRYMEKNQ